MRADATSDAIERRRHRLRQAARLPVRTVLSGPVHRRRRRAGGRRGSPASPTSSPSTWAAPRTDVALLQGGECRLASEAVVHGYPIKAPMLDIHTVGAGGGSIAYRR